MRTVSSASGERSLAALAAEAPPVEYEEMKRHIREVVAATVPPGATVAVVSKGDDELLRLGEVEGAHFPRDERGEWAGYHPENGVAAVAELNGVRTLGAEFLLLPRSSFWWLEHYPELTRHLEVRCRTVARNADACAIFALGDRPASTEHSDAPLGRHNRIVPGARALVASTLPSQARVAVVSEGDDTLLQLGRRSCHFPQATSGAAIQLSKADGPSIVAQLEELRRRGTGFLLVPATALWWVEGCSELREHLRKEARVLALRERLCAIFELTDAPPALTGNDGAGLDRTPRLLRSLWRRRRAEQ